MQASRRLALALVGLAAGAAACDGGGPSGDPFPIYASRGLYVTALLYIVFAGLCVIGLIDWRRDLRRSAAA